MTAVKRKTTFIRCKNCNRTSTLSRANSDGYCSPECRSVYTRCTTCGRYFILLKKEKEDEANKNTKDFKKATCSEECKIIYIIHKK